ncbi:MAG TPA: RNA polymerase sigma-70 factor [Flavitalea sp.]|nr:RNA polymerase sigma-70 factor [Flavitalea sp.]
MDNTRRIQNNKQSFRQFFENCFHMYYEGLHRYAYTIIKNNHDAGDIVQLVFTKWWEKGEALIIQQDIRHYLYRTVHNQCLNYARNIKNRKTYSYDFGSNQEGTAIVESHDPLITKEIINKVNRELENLPPQCKLIFYKSRFEEKKYAEIASELNLSIKTVEAQIGKALKILREKLFEDNVSILLLLICFLNKIF